MTAVYVALVISVAAALALAVMQLAPVVRERFKVDPRVPERQGGKFVILVPERRPSAGIDWSRKNHPQQYVAENVVVSKFTGLGDEAEFERYLDVGGRAYGRDFLQGFSYTETDKAPRVRIEHLKQAETLVGRIVGQGLKPNFAYQVKLRGLYETDTAGFERIGRTGRWRLPGRGTNYLDRVYAAYKDKHLVEAYLLFDFFVTDPEGNVDKVLYADSTLHVLWNANYQRGPKMTDTRPVAAYRDRASRALYAHPDPDLTPQWIYAESEQHSLAPNNRKAVNEAFLPPGKYVAEVVLTEESFHTFADGGYWPTVMRAPVEFEVAEKPRPSPYWRELGAAATLSLDKAQLQEIRKDQCADTLLTGAVLSDKCGILFTERLNLAYPGRMVLQAEVQVAGRHQWQVYLDTEDQPTETPTYVIDSDGRSGWQRFEVEITGAKGSERLRIVPARMGAKFGIRNVRIAGVKE
jgi:hypothetical protein